MKKENQKSKKELTSDFNYVEFEKDAIAGLKEGKNLAGKDGVLTGLIQRIVNAALEGELDNHLMESKDSGVKNRRNGHIFETLIF